MSVLGVGALAACSDSGGGGNTITWWQNPDASGTQTAIADNCTKASGGRYSIHVEVLPTAADTQREQIVRRLAANDKTMNLISMDVVWTGEFAEAKWLLPWTGENETKAKEDKLEGALKTATWKDTIYGIPFSSNAQLLWYRKSRMAAAGVDPTSESFTWSDMIQGASKLPEGQRFIEEQGKKYEGYMVWVNALVESAGGHIIDGEKVDINTDAGRKAAAVMEEFMAAPVKDPALSTADEEVARAAFESGSASFMLNWPYVYAVAAANSATDPKLKEVVADYGWARYPRVDASMPSKPPLGGINIGIGASTPKEKQALAFEAAACASNLENQLLYMRKSGNPAVLNSVYDDAEVRKIYPFADLIRDSIKDAGPRPVTPFYNEVSIAIQRTWHPQSSVDEGTPAKTADLIKAAIEGKVLL